MPVRGPEPLLSVIVAVPLYPVRAPLLEERVCTPVLLFVWAAVDAFLPFKGKRREESRRGFSEGRNFVMRLMLTCDKNIEDCGLLI